MIEAGEFTVGGTAGKHLEVLAGSSLDDRRDQQPVDQFLVALSLTHEGTQSALAYGLR